MKKNLKLCFLFVSLLLFGNAFGQGTTPFQGQQLCNGTITTRTNTANALTITNPRANSLVNGVTYTIKLEYLDPDLGLVTRNNSVTINKTSNSITINFPSPGLPALLCSDSWPMWINIDQTGVTPYEYYIYYSDGVYCATVLPLTLKSFSASQPTATTTKLNWTTSWEQNTLHFDIEASRNGADFGLIGRIAAAGNSSGDINYSFTHSNPYRNNTYYRLKMVDIDGRFTYSHIVRVECTACPLAVPSCSSTIDGPATVCGTSPVLFRLVSAYTHPVTWSVTPSYPATLSPSGYDATLTKANSGIVTLKAQIQGCTGTINKTIQVGTPGLTITKESPMYYPTYTRYYASVSMLPGTTSSQYSWYKYGMYVGTGSERTIIVYDTDEDCEYWQVKVTTACGESSGTDVFCYQTPPPCEGYSQFTVSPVPAKGTMTVSPNKLLPPPPCDNLSLAVASSGTYTLRIFDMYGTLRKEVKNVSLKNGHQLNVNTLSDGNYVLHIIGADSKKEIKQIRIEK